MRASCSRARRSRCPHGCGPVAPRRMRDRRAPSGLGGSSRCPPPPATTRPPRSSWWSSLPVARTVLLTNRGPHCTGPTSCPDGVARSARRSRGRPQALSLRELARADRWADTSSRTANLAVLRRASRTCGSAPPGTKRGDGGGRRCAEERCARCGSHGGVAPCRASCAARQARIHAGTGAPRAPSARAAWMRTECVSEAQCCPLPPPVAEDDVAKHGRRARLRSPMPAPSRGAHKTWHKTKGPLELVERSLGFMRRSVRCLVD